MVIHIRVIAPSSSCAAASDAIRSDPTVTDLVVIPGVAMDGAGDQLSFNVTRENANSILER